MNTDQESLRALQSLLDAEKAECARLREELRQANVVIGAMNEAFGNINRTLRDASAAVLAGDYAEFYRIMDRTKEHEAEFMRKLRDGGVTIHA